MSKRDSSTGRFASAQQAVNDERVTTDLFGLTLDQLNLSAGRIAGYLVGAMVWGYALGCVAGVAIDAVFMLSIPLVFQVIASIVIVFLAIYLSALTSFVVGVYATEGTIWAVNKFVSGAKFVKSKYQEAKVAYSDKRSMKEVFTTFKDRNFATQH